MKINILRKIITLGAVTICATNAIAQVKIGSNPTFISNNTNLEVEASNGKKVTIAKDLGTVTIDNIVEIVTSPGFIMVTNADGLVQKQSFTNLRNFILQGVSVAGTNGASVLNGATDPVSTTGSNGDFFINTATKTIFGPKANGVWPTPGTSLVGPKGDAGSPGAKGDAGSPGAKGDAGAPANVSVGTVSSLAVGAAPTVNVTGTPPAAVLNFGFPASANIYSIDGILAGNRTVTLGGNSLSFAGGTGISIQPTGVTNPLLIQKDGLDPSIFRLFSGGSYVLQSNGGVVISSNNASGVPSLVVKGGNTANTEYLRVEAGGNVGIGTNVPSNRLHVNATTDPLKLVGVQAGTNANDLMVLDPAGVVKKVPSSTIAGLLLDGKTALGTTQVTIPEALTFDIPGASITITPTVNVRVLITASACPRPESNVNPVQGTINLLQNGNKIASQFYSATDAPVANNIILGKLGNFSTITRVVDLSPGTYTFKLEAKSWLKTTIFNTDPTLVPYQGSSSSDVDAVKASITVLTYTR